MKIPDYPEQWQPVVGYENLYEISSLGNVRSLRSATRLKPFPNIDGYPQVGLCYQGAKKHKRIHVLVLEAFVGPRPLNHDSRHLDSDKSNYKLSNLEWATYAVNNQDNVARGLYRTNVPIPDDLVREIRALVLVRGETDAYCKSKGISRTSFHCIRRGVSYRSIV